MARDLYVHIGSHKTGTTSLQTTLFRNRFRLLERYSVAFLHPPNLPNAHPYIHFREEDGMVPTGYRFIDLDGLVDLLAGTTAATTVISSENFSYFFAQDTIDAFRQRVAPLFDRVFIVAYLRRQDSHMVSHHQEGAKPDRLSEELFWGLEPSALPTYTPHFDLYLDYAERLSKWQAAFGPGSVIARIYERSKLRDGDAVSDFLSLLDLPADAVDTADQANTAIGWIPCKLGHLINEYIEEEELKRYLFAALPNAERLLPTRAEAEAFYGHYAESNQRLNQLFRITDEPEVFNLDFSAYPEQVTDKWTEDTTDAALRAMLGALNKYIGQTHAGHFFKAANAVEPIDQETAERMFLAAHRLRPEGPFIRRKLESYGVEL